MQRDRTRDIVLFVFFIVLGTVGILKHEIWLDEAQHWLLARDSESLKDFWMNTRYEGHPILWSFLLFVITRISHDPLYMQIIHLAIAIISAYYVVFRLGYTPIQKTLILSSYFMLYEYTVISRNYAILVLLFLIALKKLESKCSNPFALVLIIILLANTHLFGVMLSISLFTISLVNKENFATINKYQSVALFVSLGLGISFAILRIIPPSDSSLLTNSSIQFSMVNVLRSLLMPLKGLLPIPNFFDYHFWNSNLIVHLSKPIAGLISLLLLFLPMVVFKKRESLILFYLSTLQFMLFISISGFSAARYAGIVFILFIGCISLEQSLSGSVLSKKFIFPSRPSNYIVLIILSLQSVSGIYVFAQDFVKPFSEGKSVVRYLEKHGLNNRVILGEFCESTTISTYIKSKIFYIELNQFGSFCRWNWNDTFFRDDKALMNEVLNLADKLERKPLFIHYKLLPLDDENARDFNLIASFTESIIRNENFYIYEVNANSSEKVKN